MNHLKRALSAPFELIAIFAATSDWGDGQQAMPPVNKDALRAFKRRHGITAGRVGRDWFAERSGGPIRSEIATGANELAAIRAYCQQTGTPCDL